MVTILIFWFVTATPYDRKKSIKTKFKFSGLLKRKIKELEISESIKLKRRCNDIYVLNRRVFLVPLEPQSEGQLLELIDTNVKQLNIGISKATITSIAYKDSSFLIVARDEEKKLSDAYMASIYKIDPEKELTQFRITIPHEHTSLATGEYYYNVSTREKITYLYKYHYILNRPVDSLNISNIFNTYGKDMEIALFGRLVTLDSTLVYKSVFSSEGLIISLFNFKIYKQYKTLDSLMLPKITEHHATNISYLHVDPEIYATWQVRRVKTKIVMLSWLDYDFLMKKSKTNFSYLDVYSNDLKYISSYRLAPIDNSIMPYSFDFTNDGEYVYVLYDDFRTLEKYRVE